MELDKTRARVYARLRTRAAARVSPRFTTRARAHGACSYFSPLTCATLECATALRLVDEALGAAADGAGVTLIDATAASLTLAVPLTTRDAVIEYRPLPPARGGGGGGGGHEAEAAPGGWHRAPLRTGAGRIVLRRLAPATPYAVRVVRGEAPAAAPADGAPAAAAAAHVVVFATRPSPPLAWDAGAAGPGVVIGTSAPAPGDGEGASPARPVSSATFAGAETWSMVLGARGYVAGRAGWGVRIERSSASPCVCACACAREWAALFCVCVWHCCAPHFALLFSGGRSACVKFQFIRVIASGACA